jgi:hypothetical protein
MTIDGVVDWILDLLTTYTHNMELQVNTLNYSNIANLHSLQSIRAHAKSFQPSVSSPAILWQRLLTVEILQLHAFLFSMNSDSLPTE